MTASGLPGLTTHGLLPPGVYICTLEEVRALFGRFLTSDCRLQLIKRLEAYVAEIGRSGIAKSLIVDGSFVMAIVEEPEDIDMVVVLADNWDLQANLRPFEYNLLSKRYVKKRFGFDVFVVRDESPEEREWLDFFAQVNPKWTARFGLPHGLKKGVLRVSL